MATLAELIQPFFQARLQGKEAVRKASDSLNMDKFEREVQAIREKKEEDRRKREGNLKIGLDLTQAGYDPKMAFGGDWYGNPQGLATLPNLNPSADKFLSAYGGNMSDLDRAAANSGLDLKTIYANISKRLQDEADNAARLKAVQARAATGGGSGVNLGLPYGKEFEQDTIGSALFRSSPMGQELMRKIAPLRQQSIELGKQLAPMYAKQADGLSFNETGFDSLSAMKAATDMQLQNALGDSANFMDRGIKVPNFFPEAIPQIQAYGENIIREMAQDGLTTQELIDAGFSPERAQEIMAQYTYGPNRP